MRIHGLRTILTIGAALSPAAVSAQAVDYQALQATVGEPVTTSVTGTPQRASELPASATIITRDDIARSPARDVPGLLKTLAGVDVNRWTAGQTDVAVRGGVQTYNARLLVLVDGRQVYLDHYGMTDWNLLGVQLEEIQQIELVRGPANALFGFNAASGVVNIITRRGGATPSATATAEAGDHGASKLAASVLLPVTPTIGLKLAAGRAREDERAIPATLLRPEMVFDVASDQVSGDVDGTFGAVQVSLGAGHATNRQVEYLPSQLLSNQRYSSDTLHGTVTRDTPWGGLTLNGYVNWLDAEYGVGAGPGATDPIDYRNRIIVAQASSLVRLDTANTLRLGVEYRNNRLESDYQFAQRISYDVASANAMLDLRPLDRVSFTVAGRLDRLWLHQSGVIARPTYDDPAAFDRAFNRFSFNAALLIRTGGDGMLRINGGRGYQLPSLVNFGIRLPIITPAPIPIFVAGSPRIDPVTVWSGEVGYTQPLGAIKLEATAFATWTQGAIASPGDGLQTETFFTPLPSLVARFRAVGDYTTYGVELAASGQLANLTWRANYSWTHTDDRLPPTTLPIPYALAPQAATPVHKANVILGYEVGPVTLSGVARFTAATRQLAFSPTPQLLLYPVADAVALDARVGYRVMHGFDLFVAVDNLALARGAAVSPIPADRRIRAGVRLAL
ncbi:TonB-dependent receptor plug domain-containing protein [Sphingomonas sp. PAMC 26617]|uniref:TonB-dependent receptor plug domain-containing protein n=1 Tax=Sphingomonas sp. PAMC 26617 TaxID=1112216 RepID=UPI00028A26F8|nr:TonB-dependent receptor [Sphingomonas sp. PAMC 26617]